MKTSYSQFELLITFMEQHGDLTKLCSDANGRLQSLRKWEQLKELLNSDGSGDSKATEKWKKVWSDFKNNTKKKAARLHREAHRTGGGPANFAKLSNLEERVLNLIGITNATGLAVEEAGLSQRTVNHLVVGPVPSPIQLETEDSNHIQTLPTRPTLPIPLAYEEIEVQTSRQTTPPAETGTAPEIITTPPQVFLSVEDTDMLVPRSTSLPNRQPQQPSSTGQVLAQSQLRVTLSGSTTPRRARPTRTRGSPRRRVRPAYTEQATEHFLQSDQEWRKFKMEQHRDLLELRREQNRIRANEVQAQMDWQAVSLRALDLLEKIVNKYCNE
ncbi:hypothetical protein ACJJTC_004647 [Scirpophaga incertulas]